MLFKAHRFRAGPDTYNPAEHVLKTICKDPETYRPRDIRPGEEVLSIWDDLHHEGTTFFYGKLRDHLDESDPTIRRVFDEPNKFPRSLFYNKADELEDEILFPEERAEKKLDPLDVGKVEPIKVWEEEGFSLRKFVEGWDSDWDAFSPSEGEEESEWEDEDDVIKGDDRDSINKDEEMANIENGPENKGGKANLDTVENGRHIGYSDELREIMAKLVIKDRGPPKDRGDPAVMQAEFMGFLDKEKAKSMAQWNV
jgi:hypothetical protein